jgi:hypothetical protein
MTAAAAAAVHIHHLVLEALEADLAPGKIDSGKY